MTYKTKERESTLRKLGFILGLITINAPGPEDPTHNDKKSKGASSSSKRSKGANGSTSSPRTSTAPSDEPPQPPPSRSVRELYQVVLRTLVAQQLHMIKANKVYRMLVAQQL